MSDKPEALRLADDLDEKWWRWKDNPTIELKAATELRRLHAENDALQNTKHYEAPRGFVLNPDYLVPELQAQRDALLVEVERLKRVNYDMAGDLTVMSATKQMQAAIDAARGEK